MGFGLSIDSDNQLRPRFEMHSINCNANARPQNLILLRNQSCHPICEQINSIATQYRPQEQTDSRKATSVSDCASPLRLLFFQERIDFQKIEILPSRSIQNSPSRNCEQTARISAVRLRTGKNNNKKTLLLTSFQNQSNQLLPFFTNQKSQDSDLNQSSFRSSCSAKVVRKDSNSSTVLPGDSSADVTPSESDGSLTGVLSVECVTVTDKNSQNQQITASFVLFDDRSR
jgi:hypothetical protein